MTVLVHKWGIGGLSQVLTSVAAGAVCFILLIACAEHLRTPRTLPDALAEHRTVPASAVRPLALTVTLVEGILALSIGLLVVGEGSSVALTWMLAAAALLFGAYTAYTWRLMGRSVRCGCTRTDAPVTGWVVVRTGALAVLAAFAAARPDAIVTPGESGARFAEVAVAGAAFAVLLWILPEAMLEPGRSQRSQEG